MRSQVLTFVIASFAMLTLSRCILATWQWRRVRMAGGLRPILTGGLRIDAVLIAMLAGIPALLSPWLGHYQAAVTVTGWWLMICWLLLILLEVSTPQFIYEYDTRPNRLYIEYLKNPREVSGMLWKGYKTVIFGGLLVIALLMWVGSQLFGYGPADTPMVWWLRVLSTVIIGALLVAMIRGTWSHRPVNPSSVAYCGDSMLNTLALNSLYSVIHAAYSMKNERSAADVYGDMPADEMHAIVNGCAGIHEGGDIPSLHTQTPITSHERPLNIVLIIEESLGAQFVGNLGGADLTPCLDKLAGSSWNFTRTYATGTRSVRGLEAVVAGFPPTISDASLRLSGAQSNFFTLAQLLKPRGYRSRFIYGGEAHFDNMKSFFLGNGFDELYERSSFSNPAFVGTWGASDEDMFNQLDTLLQSPIDQPTLTLAFSVSNHTPWEYPAGRIEPRGNPATNENSVRYADWAIGRFFEKAQQSAYWRDTIFLVVADHDARVGGASLVPLRHFHIPALIAGAGIQARSDDRLISQIDLAPTLLSIAGVQSEHPMIGHDLTRAGGGRAMMQYNDNYGYLRGDQLIVLEPHRPPTQYLYRAPETYTPAPLNPRLAKEALAHVLWPTWMYSHQRYTLPQLRQGR